MANETPQSSAVSDAAHDLAIARLYRAQSSRRIGEESREQPSSQRQTPSSGSKNRGLCLRYQHSLEGTEHR
jgi:hypothetical protein